MTTPGIPGWFGWPSMHPAPGRDWSPNRTLRFTTLSLLYIFLALALTVNYAYSAAFFILAAIGVYAGLRKGFLYNLSRAERVVVAAFATYVVVAIISYLLGAQTRVGFRFLGRDLRFLLFIPIYVAVRSARPRLRDIGTSLSLGAIICCAVAAWQFTQGITPTGATSIHITFGDLALLSGTLGIALTPKGRTFAFSLAVGGALAGLLAALLSGSRGAWIAIPGLLVIFFWTSLDLFAQRRRIIIASAVAVTMVGCGAVFGIPLVRHRATSAIADFYGYVIAANHETFAAKCVDKRRFLNALLFKSSVIGPGNVGVVTLSPKDKKILRRDGCVGGAALQITSPKTSTEPVRLSLYRGHGRHLGGRQKLLVVARGNGRIALWRQKRSNWIPIRSRASWHTYEAHGYFSRTATGIIRVPPGGHLLVVPIQSPPALFARALVETSIGERMEMWRAAWDMFLIHPIIGSGTGSFKALGARSAKKPALTLAIGDYEHAHNSYLTALATKGAIGFASLLFLLTTPFLTRSTSSKSPIRSFAPLLSFGFAAFSLTESMFVHSLVISWFTVVMAAALGATTFRSRANQ